VELLRFEPLHLPQLHFAVSLVVFIQWLHKLILHCLRLLELLLGLLLELLLELLIHLLLELLLELLLHCFRLTELMRHCKLRLRRRALMGRWWRGSATGQRH
jgi:hypothetical protein